MHADGFEARSIVGFASGSVEVVPHRDPSEAEIFDPTPDGAQFVRCGVLQTDMDTEQSHVAEAIRVHSSDRDPRPC